MSNYSLSTESWLEKHYVDTVNPFWQSQAQLIDFIGGNHRRINGAYLCHPNPIGSIVISSGRVESYVKYKELSYDLFQNGYSVFLIDHRGQGFSERLANNPQLGHVDNFNYYIDDLKLFYDTVASPRSSSEPMLLCHSMGACIGFNYLIQYPNDFHRAALCAPLVGFRSFIPKTIASKLVDSAIKVNQWKKSAPTYFWGMGDYEDAPFKQNRLTHSAVRYQIFRQEYQLNPCVQLGGPSFEWIKRAHESCQDIFEQIHKIATPCLMLQAEQDEVVDNKAQIALSNMSPILQLQQLAQAKHEILIEKDSIRNAALQAILDFYATPAHQ